MNNIKYFISKNLTKAQIIIIAGAFVLILILVIVWLFIYNPGDKKIRWLNEQYEKLSRSLILPKTIIKKSGSLEEMTKSLEKEIEDFSKRFPKKEDEVINQISESARFAGLEITSMRNGSRETLADVSITKIEGFIMQRLPVDIELTGSYESLIKFFRNLKNDITGYIYLEQLKITKTDEASTKLIITMQINLLLNQ